MAGRGWAKARPAKLNFADIFLKKLAPHKNYSAELAPLFSVVFVRGELWVSWYIYSRAWMGCAHQFFNSSSVLHAFSTPSRSPPPILGWRRAHLHPPRALPRSEPRQYCADPHPCTPAPKNIFSAALHCAADAVQPARRDLKELGRPVNTNAITIHIRIHINKTRL